MFLELRPPDRGRAGGVSCGKKRPACAGRSGRCVFAVARALQGLTLDEARYALRRALAASPQLGPEALPALLEEKRLLVNRSGVIEFIAEGASLGEIGGLEGLKKWLLERRKLFQMRDSLSAEIVPKGVLHDGHSGLRQEPFGEGHRLQLSASAVPHRHDRDLLRPARQARRRVRGRVPDDGGHGARRCCGSTKSRWASPPPNPAASRAASSRFFLTWMQEKTRGLFVAATANRIDLLPAEMIRKGRFDEVFFVDLPLRRGAHRDLQDSPAAAAAWMRAGFDLTQLTEFTIGWAGAEIEQCVVSAITKARLEDREMTDEDLIGIAASIVPLSRTMKEQINHIRGWAFERAVRASPNVLDR